MTSQTCCQGAISRPGRPPGPDSTRRDRLSLKQCLPLIFSLLLAIPGLSADADAPRGAFKGAVDTSHPTWFKESFLDFEEDIADAAANGRRLVLYFFQDGCPYCNALVEHNFTQPDITKTMREKFDLVAINIWGDREVIQVGGQVFSEKDLAEALKIQYTPTLLFFNEQRRVVLRLNGYQPPDTFRTALEFVHTRKEATGSFTHYLEQLGTKSSSQDLISESFFISPPYDLRPGSNKPLAVFFEQPVCQACEAFHARVLNNPTVRRLITQYDVVQLGLWAKTPVITPSDDQTTARQWAETLAIGFTPTVVLFDVEGREVMRLEASFRTFHTQGILRYVLSGSYRKQPSFQRYLSAHADHLREQGYDVDIFSYDSPISRNGKLADPE
ncbi:MAG: thioredoxin fold domain-containing protein [Arenicellales bacterium]|nr:thioredoxin fold domain-containing protein [Arenicellales bacterium]